MVCQKTFERNLKRVKCKKFIPYYCGLELWHLINNWVWAKLANINWITVLHFIYNDDYLYFEVWCWGAIFMRIYNTKYVLKAKLIPTVKQCILQTRYFFCQNYFKKFDISFNDLKKRVCFIIGFLLNWLFNCYA